MSARAARRAKARRLFHSDPAAWARSQPRSVVPYPDALDWRIIERTLAPTLTPLRAIVPRTGGAVVRWR